MASAAKEVDMDDLTRGARLNDPQLARFCLAAHPAFMSAAAADQAEVLAAREPI